MSSPAFYVSIMYQWRDAWRRAAFAKLIYLLCQWHSMSGATWWSLLAVRSYADYDFMNERRAASSLAGTTEVGIKTRRSNWCIPFIISLWPPPAMKACEHSLPPCYVMADYNYYSFNYVDLEDNSIVAYGNTDMCKQDTPNFNTIFYYFLTSKFIRYNHNIIIM